MQRLVESKVVYVLACASVAAAIGFSMLTGSALPAFGSSLLPQPSVVERSQSPFPPPPPRDKTGIVTAQSPFPPPPPRDKTGIVTAQSPFPPPPPRATRPAS
jgi:hypothetical protein